MPGPALVIRCARFFRIRQIVLDGIVQRRDLVGKRVLQICQRVLQMRAGNPLIEPRMTLSQTEQLRDSIYGIAG